MYFLYWKAELPKWDTKILSIKYTAFANVEKVEGEMVTQWHIPEKTGHFCRAMINDTKMQIGG